MHLRARLAVRLAAIAVVAASGLLPLPARAQAFKDILLHSNTVTSQINRLCFSANGTVELACPSYAPSLTTAGDISVTGALQATRFVGDGSGLTGLTANVSVTAGASGSIVYRDAFGSLTASSLFSISSTTGSVGIGAGAPSWLGNYGLYVQGGGYFNQLSLVTGGQFGWGDTSTRITGSDTSRYLSLYTSNTEAMRIVSSGYVGIGTTQPSEKLQVFGNIYGQTIYAGAANAFAWYGWNSRIVGDSTQNYIYFVTSNTEAMRIVSTGYVGIGTSTPVTKLNVNGTALVTSWTGVNMTTTPSVPLDVSGSIRASGVVQVSGTAGESCASAADVGKIRVDPATGHFQICKQ